MSDWCRVVLADGRILPDGEAGDPDSAVFGLDGLTVEWGRDNVLDQPAASTVALSVILGPPPYPEWVRSQLLTVGARLWVTTMPSGGSDTVAYARVSDVTLSWDPGRGCARAEITAVDHLGQLESEEIGDAPWPVQPIAARVARLGELTATGVLFEIPPAAVAGSSAQTDLGAIPVAAQDIDATALAGVLQDLAAAGDAAAWPVYGPSATAAPPVTGPLVWLRSNLDRLPLQTLHVGSGGLVTVGQPLHPFTVPGANWAHVSACWFPRDDAAWGRSASTLVTRAGVGWLDASTITAEEPDATERTVTIVDAALEAAQGVHGTGFETLLTTAAAAQALAVRVLTRSGLDQWLTDGLRIDQVWIPPADPVYGDTAATLARLLVSHTRSACPILLDELPDWAPMPLDAGGVLLAYVEGGSYTFTGGRWILDIRLSAAGAGVPAPWQAVPPAVPLWSWSNVDPAVRWADAAVPVEG